MFHHPYSWFDPETSPEFKHYIEKTYDAAFTGHEHSDDAYRKSRDLGQTDFFEGDVFQETPNRAKGGFRLVVIDTKSKQLDSYLYQWDKKDGKYSETSERLNVAFLRNAARLRTEFALRPAAQTTLDEPGEDYQHPRKQNLTREDIFVAPDCLVRRMSVLPPKNILSRRRFSKDLLNEHKRVCIVGPEYCGRTTLAKQAFQWFRGEAMIPLLIKGCEITSASPDAVASLLEQVLRRTYLGDIAGKYRAALPTHRAIIVDDFDTSPLTWKARMEVLEQLHSIASHVVVTTRNEPMLDIAATRNQNDPDTSIFDEYQILFPQELGNERRFELVKRWCALGITDHDQESKFDQDIMARQRLLTQIISKRIIAVYPLYVLLCLQQIEVAQNPDLGGGSFGYLYESLLTVRLTAVKSAVDLNLRHNFAGELAEHMCGAGTTSMTNHDFELFVSRYNQKYDTMFSAMQMASACSAILSIDESGLKFRHRFSYYYYVARYIAAHLDEDEVQSRVRTYAATLHTDFSGTVLMFLCHLAKDRWFWI